MKPLLLLINLLFFGQIFTDYSQERVLVFTKTTGFRHKSIPKGVETVKRILQSEDIAAVHTEDARYFCPDSLSQVGAVIFLCTNANIFNDEQKAAFQHFIRTGNGLVGMHAASDREVEGTWYGEL